MSFNGFILMRMLKSHLKANFNLISRTELLMCFYIILQISFQNFKGQTIYCNVWVFGRISVWSLV